MGLREDGQSRLGPDAVPRGSCGGCQFSVWSTPRNPQNHADLIRGQVDACPHAGGNDADDDQGAPVHPDPAGVTGVTDALEDAVLAAGCDDALLWSRLGVTGLHFDREAESLGDAIGSAVKDVERAGFAVARVDVEDPGEG